MTHSHGRAQELVSNVSALLRTERMGRAIRAYENVTSTNTLASQWAAEGAPSGAVVYAELQTEGRGRLGRTWKAQPGLNLTFSVVLRPDLRVERLGLVTVASCVAVSEAIDDTASPLDSALKWPNDILLRGKKCSGMLLETSLPARDAIPEVILGIGVNVNQDAFPDQLSGRATSLLLELGRPVDRSSLMAGILNRLEARIDQVSSDPKHVQRQYMARMADLDETVRLRFSDAEGEIQGVALGLDPSGGIILETQSGRRVFHAGEVTRSR